MGKISIREVQPGDVVVLRHKQNFIEAEVYHADGLWYVDCFHVKIPFARDKRDGLTKNMIPGVDLAGHMSQITSVAAES